MNDGRVLETPWERLSVSLYSLVSMAVIIPATLLLLSAVLQLLD